MMNLLLVIAALFAVTVGSTVPPGPPRNVTANITCKALSLKWQHPLDNGGMEILGYNITVLSNGKQLIVENADKFSVERDIAYDFKPATRYEIRLGARNEAGIGKEETVFVTTDDKYSLPFINTIASPSEVYSYIGNSDPTWVQCKFGGYPNPWVTMRFGDKLISNATTTAEVKLITDDIKYFGVYKCHAENDCGFQNFSVDLKLARNPSEVLNFKAVPTCNSITLTWRTPTDDGGMPINKYVLVYKSIIRNIDGDDTTYTIQDLKQNTKCNISLRATSKAEWGPRSSVETQTTTYCAPGRPIIYSPSSTLLTKFTLKWRAPEETGDDDNITYTVRYRVETDWNYFGPWKTITTKSYRWKSPVRKTAWSGTSVR
ncbi:axonal fasciculation [Desmophyllum pertusum]|uniref:Axonal fasciculation n=1 Tax=Desmophyllum pertusum TaxID=174260 RepID=A0A9W9YFE6_9CNID|nr:axonal fasciculation [Desmophyllum pertusum]